MSYYTLSTQRRAFTFFFFILLVFTIVLIEPFLLSSLLAVVLVVLFQPLYKRFLSVFGNRPYLASLSSTFIVGILLVLPAVLVLLLVVNQAPDVIDRVRFFIQSGELSTLLQKANVNFESLTERIEKTFKITINLESLRKDALTQLGLFKTSVSLTSSILTGTLSFVLQSFLMMILVFFLFVEGKLLSHQLLMIVPLKETHKQTLIQEIRNMIYSVIYGSFITALVQATLAGTAFYFLDINGYMVWALLTFVFCFVPFIGAASIWVPMALILFFSGSKNGGIFLGIYGFFVISGIDNLLKPILMRGRTQIHPVLLFFAVMGGIRFFGPVGILLGPITIAVLIAAFRLYKQDYLLGESLEEGGSFNKPPQ